MLNSGCINVLSEHNYSKLRSIVQNLTVFNWSFVFCFFFLQYIALCLLIQKRKEVCLFCYALSVLCLVMSSLRMVLKGLTKLQLEAKLWSVTLALVKCFVIPNSECSVGAQLKSSADENVQLAS